MNQIETIEFQIANTRAAIRMVDALKPWQFSHGLYSWNERPGVKAHLKSLIATGHTCGTIACFGGWLPHDEYFKGIGVVATPGGVPYNMKYGNSAYLAQGLFGNVWLFDPTHLSEIQDFGDERAVVLARLHANLDRLELGLLSQQREEVRKANMQAEQARAREAGIRARQESERIARQASTLVEKVRHIPNTMDMGHVA